MVNFLNENKKNILWILAFLLTVILLVALLSNISIIQVVDSLRKISIEYLLLAYFFYFCSYIVKTFRYRIILRLNNKPFSKLLNITIIHNFYNQLLPAGTGELSFPLLLKKYLNINLSVGTATIVFIRIVDVSAIFFILTIGLMFTEVSLSPLLDFSKYYIIAASLSISLLILFALSFSSVINTKYIETISVKNKILLVILKIVGELSSLPSKNILARTVLLSLFSNMFSVLIFWAIINGMEVQITIWQCMIASTILLPILILPLRGIAGFGTTEGGWFLALSLVGIQKAAIIPLAFGIHILILFFVLAFTLLMTVFNLYVRDNNEAL